MRPCLCDFCGDIIPDEEVYELETCHATTGRGLSFEICEHCHYELQSRGEGIAFHLLLGGDKDVKKDEDQT